MGSKHMPRVPLMCGWCGVIFSRLACEVRQGEGKYCSRPCTTKATKTGKSLPKFETPPSTKAERTRAQGLINMRLRRGAIVKPEACTECGEVRKLDAHHEDYARPDCVEWLCRSCHMKRHNKRR